MDVTDEQWAVLEPLTTAFRGHQAQDRVTVGYTWRQNKRVERGGFRSLRPAPRA